MLGAANKLLGSGRINLLGGHGVQPLSRPNQPAFRMGHDGLTTQVQSHLKKKPFGSNRPRTEACL